MIEKNIENQRGLSEQRVKELIDKWSSLLDSETASNATAMLIEPQETILIEDGEK